MRGLYGVICGALALLSAPARADVVSDWSELQTAIDKGVDNPDDSFQADTYQAGSKLTLAMFEAANGIDRKYESWLKLAPPPKGASGLAAVDAAARDMLVALYPGQRKKIEKAYTLALMAVPAGPAREAGVSFGRAAAVAALSAGGLDPALPKGSYRPIVSVGKWSASGVPFPPEYVASRPWFMTKASQFRAPPPPSLTSKSYTDSFNETKAIGSRNSAVRTPEQTMTARFWRQYGIDSVMRQIDEQPGRSLVQNARFYALTQMALDDFTIMTIDGKMTYMFWRPFNAIRTADIDGNDATTMDPNWEPLLRTPAQPEYPCGHCGFAAVFGTILAAEGPVPAGGYRFVSDSLDGLSITMPTATAYMDAVDNSRIYGGVHWRMTAEATRPMGIGLARLAMIKFAPPLK